MQPPISSIERTPANLYHVRMLSDEHHRQMMEAPRDGGDHLAGGDATCHAVEVARFGDSNRSGNLR